MKRGLLALGVEWSDEVERGCRALSSNQCHAITTTMLSWIASPTQGPDLATCFPLIASAFPPVVHAPTDRGPDPSSAKECRSAGCSAPSPAASSGFDGLCGPSWARSGPQMSILPRQLRRALLLSSRAQRPKCSIGAPVINVVARRQ